MNTSPDLARTGQLREYSDDACQRIEGTEIS